MAYGQESDEWVRHSTSLEFFTQTSLNFQENFEISAHSTLSLNSLLEFLGSLDTFWFSLEWNSSFWLAHCLLLAGKILAIFGGFHNQLFKNHVILAFFELQKTPEITENMPISGAKIH